MRTICNTTFPAGLSTEYFHMHTAKDCEKYDLTRHLKNSFHKKCYHKLDSGKKPKTFRTKWHKCSHTLAIETAIREGFKNFNLFTALEYYAPEGSLVFRDLAFDIDNEDIAVSQKMAVKLLNYLNSIGLPNIGVKLSGSKGFHLRSAAELMTDVPKYCHTKDTQKAFAEKISGELDLNLDLSIYAKRHMFRLVNSQHQKTGLYAIPLTHEELVNMSIDQIIKLAENPRPTDSFGAIRW